MAIHRYCSGNAYTSITAKLPGHRLHVALQCIPYNFARLLLPYMKHCGVARSPESMYRNLRALPCAHLGFNMTAGPLPVKVVGGKLLIASSLIIIDCSMQVQTFSVISICWCTHMLNKADRLVDPECILAFVFVFLKVRYWKTCFDDPLDVRRFPHTVCELWTTKS